MFCTRCGVRPDARYTQPAVAPVLPLMVGCGAVAAGLAVGVWPCSSSVATGNLPFPPDRNAARGNGATGAVALAEPPADGRPGRPISATKSATSFLRLAASALALSASRRQSAVSRAARSRRLATWALRSATSCSNRPVHWCNDPALLWLAGVGAAPAPKLSSPIVALPALGGNPTPAAWPRSSAANPLRSMRTMRALRSASICGTCKSCGSTASACATEPPPPCSDLLSSPTRLPPVPLMSPSAQSVPWLGCTTPAVIRSIASANDCGLPSACNPPAWSPSHASACGTAAAPYRLRTGAGDALNSPSRRPPMRGCNG
mmetsp:Transcript_21262/g.41620  ORF Transcript_21262/g.41620 Transcript_21262/m.41620 type:complete len:318 (+) Transcript_21262:191-1144(+)